MGAQDEYVLHQPGAKLWTGGFASVRRNESGDGTVAQRRERCRRGGKRREIYTTDDCERQNLCRDARQ